MEDDKKLCQKVYNIFASEDTNMNRIMTMLVWKHT